jgi:SAM-dependent methyltransferase
MATSGAQNDLRVFLRGERLYGDDFTLDEIAEWYEDEREGYSDLGYEGSGERGDAADREYPYFALNQRHGFRHAPGGFENILSVGGATGAELLPVAAGARRIVVLEPSQATRSTSVAGVSVEYTSPRPDGKLPFPDQSFDLVTCFGTLHHMANVSTVVGEMFRCCRPGGYALLREPSTSMGDWRRPRPGITKRERGIPPRLFRNIATGSGFTVLRETKCMFSLMSRMPRALEQRLLHRPMFNVPAVVVADQLLSALFAWNERYHRTTVPQKLGPTCMFLVLRREEARAPGHDG